MIHGVLGPSIGIVDDYFLSTEAYEGDICCTVSYPTVSDVLCVPKQFPLDLYCIRLSSEPMSVIDFALPSGKVSDVFFS